VAQGIYKPDRGAGITPGDREATFQLVNGVTIKGGYAGAGHPDPDIRDVEIYETILSGDLNGNDDPDNRNTWDENSHCILTAGNTDQTAVLDGVTATASRGGLPSAGLYNLTSSPTVIDCTFSRNSTTGVFNDYYSAPTFVNCTFRENMERCGMRNERSNPTLMGCIFIDNSSGNMRGGGMYNYYSDPTLINCEFIGNFAGREGAYSLYGGGGGMYIDSSDPMLFGCTFTGNCSVNNKGGAIRNLDGDPILINCSFSGNSASNNEGGGIYDDFGTTILVNCILWGNTDENGSGQSSQIYFKVGYPTVNYCCIQGWNGQWGGVGNIGDDPLLMDPDGVDNVPGTCDDNLRLRPGSPCADAGDNLAVPKDSTDLDGDSDTQELIPMDLDGDDRFRDDPEAADTGNGPPPIVDMGAFEGPKQGLLLDVKSIVVPEGDKAVFTVALTLDPGRTVEVRVFHQSGDDDITVESGALLTFDSSNYSNPQTVTLAADEDWDRYFGTAQIWVSAPNLPLEGVVATEGDNDPGPNILYVNGTGGNDNNDGLTKETAFATIRRGIEAAQRDGDIVIVADGVYHDPSVDFKGKAITVRSESGPYNCILSGGCYGAWFYSGEGPDSILQGFTIRYADPGAGIACYDSSPTITGNIITGNWSEYGEGSVLLHNSRAVLTNNIIVGNSVYGPCAGIVVCHGSSVTIANNTIVGNTLPWKENNGGVYCTSEATAKITNCIFWNNGDYDLYGCTATYSCLQHEHPGEGNIYENPMFVSMGHWDDDYDNWVDFDFRLLPDSPCIDAGDASYMSEPNDLDGKPRVMGGRIDMGAYEMPILAEARILPQTINLASKGNWITCYIWLPDEYNATDIEPNSIFLEGQIQPEQFSVDEQAQVATARFSREDVLPILNVGDIELKITGKLTDGTVFEVTDKIKVTDKAGK